MSNVAYGKIPESAIEAVRNAHDIVETVGKYVHLTKNGKYMKGLCPFHSERTPSFTVTPELQIFHCYGCGKSGNVIRFIAEIEGYSFPEAVRVMAEEAGIPVTWADSADSGPPANPDRDKQIEAHELAAKLYHYLLMNTPQGQSALAYLRGRGMSDKLIDQFSIGYAPESWDTLARFLEARKFPLALMEKAGLLSAKQDGSGYVDRFRGRVMFPIWNRDGKVIAFAGRIMGDGQPKYLNSPESPLFTKSRTLYNFNHARPDIRKRRKVVLFEGYMDVIKTWSAGIRNGVATMGTALTDDHAAILSRSADEIIICYDGDNAGKAAAMKAIPMFEKAGMSVSVAMLPGGMDPDEAIEAYGPDAFLRDVMDHPVSAVKFKLIYLRKNHMLEEDEGRRKYLIEAARIIAELESATDREVYMQELSRELSISIESLKQDVHAVRQTMQNLQSPRDNNGFSWNNGRNEKRPSSAGPPTLLPAYQQAERKLLSVMMRDAETARTVHDRLGDAFNVEDHAALAAYLYAFYAQGHDPDVKRFISTLQDDRLERTAASILLMDGDFPFNEQLLDDFIREIRKMPRIRELEQKKEQLVRAERSGDIAQAVQIASEIIALERQLKGRQDDRF